MSSPDVPEIGQPWLSIVIPMKNEAENVGFVADAVAAACAAFAPLELICVDDGSDDDTAARVLDAAARHPFVRLVQHPVSAGQSVTITNIGSYGMDTGTPILNPGEVGIVALGAIKQKPWVVDGEVRPAFVTTVGASFDHRIVDGDVASRFTADVASVLEEPALLLD